MADLPVRQGQTISSTETEMSDLPLFCPLTAKVQPIMRRLLAPKDTAGGNLITFETPTHAAILLAY